MINSVPISKESLAQRRILFHTLNKLQYQAMDHNYYFWLAHVKIHKSNIISALRDVFSANKCNISQYIPHTFDCDNKLLQACKALQKAYLLKHFCLVAFTTDEKFHPMSMVTGLWHNFLCTSRESIDVRLEFQMFSRQSATGIVQIERSKCINNAKKTSVYILSVFKQPQSTSLDIKLMLLGTGITDVLNYTATFIHRLLSVVE